MFARLIVPAVLGSLLLSTSVFAAGSTATPTAPAKEQNKVQTAAVKSAERCTSLQAQFDEALTTHGSAAKAADAKMLRAEGGKLCTAGQHSAGIVKIEQAFKDLGVTPKM
jgi:hypothetical protein